MVMTNLDICAAHAQRVDSSLNARLCARSIDDDIGTRTQLALLDQVPRILFCADACALEACVCSVLERKL